ncbi:MAG: adenylate cyclase [Parcubacteria group bacterium]|nr:adenylate cyclase [Parcubacteria group bacterium]
MPHINAEIKARFKDVDTVRAVLKEHGADFKGLDHQIDTYFKIIDGRLKLREGNIENYLIYYKRNENAGLKESEVILYPFEPTSRLKDILIHALEKLVVVDKKREIYFIDNVKFHIDNVEGLGSFIEIEARDTEGSIGLEKLHGQCAEWMKRFTIESKDLVSGSYSDLLMSSTN